MFHKHARVLGIIAIVCTGLGASEDKASLFSETENPPHWGRVCQQTSDSYDSIPSILWDSRPQTEDETAHRISLIFTWNYVTTPGSIHRFVNPLDIPRFKEEVGLSPSIETLRMWIKSQDTPTHDAFLNPLGKFEIVLKAVREGRIRIQESTVFVISERYPLGILEPIQGMDRAALSSRSVSTVGIRNIDLTKDLESSPSSEEL
ncbi:MAG: hypothetical protein H6849_01800 [Alphaproteobacteria bacterium]|nr:MAG: hypothetical protein H6849_01800 [Alphaproteobacteria bacterium]